MLTRQVQLLTRLSKQTVPDLFSLSFVIVWKCNQHIRYLHLYEHLLLSEILIHVCEIL